MKSFFSISYLSKKITELFNYIDMNITVLSPDKELFAGEITGVKVPGINGQFEILNNHAAIVSSLGEGGVKITKSGGELMTFQIEKGFVEVLRNEVSLLVQGISGLE